jgi:hypothetical protein
MPAVRSSIALLLAVVLLAACADDGDSPTTTTAGGDAPTTAAATTTTGNPAETTTTTTLPFTPPFIVDPYYEYEAVLSIPVGNDGVAYRDPGLDDFLPTGPTAMTIGVDGTIYLADPIGGRILGFDRADGATSEIDLASLAVGPIFALDADAAGLLALEVDVNRAPPVYRAHRIAGATFTSYPLDEDLYLENGLSGARLDDEGGIIIELEGGFRLFSIGLEGSTPIDAFTAAGRTFVIGDRSIAVDGTTVRPPATGDLGGVRFLAARPDGSWYLVQEDVVSTSPLEVEVWVRFYDPADRLAASSRVPIEERYYVPEQSLAVGPDGEVYHLLPRRESVDVVQLGFVSGAG